MREPILKLGFLLSGLLVITRNPDLSIRISILGSEYPVSDILSQGVETDRFSVSIAVAVTDKGRTPSGRLGFLTSFCKMIAWRSLMIYMEY